MANDSANGSAAGSAFKTGEGNTSSSSESGASVASMRHPLTTMPSSVFSTSLSARSASVCPAHPAARLARGETDVEVIGRASEHPAAEVGPGLHHARALAQVFGAFRNDERQAGAAAVVGAKGHRLGMLHLHVVERGARARAMGEGGMRGTAAGARAADPDFRA